MPISDLRQLTRAALQMCEEVANGGHDDQLIESLRSNPFANHQPNGYGPDVAHWIDAVIMTGTTFQVASKKDEGPVAYKMRLRNLIYSLERLAAAAEAVKP